MISWNISLPLQKLGPRRDAKTICNLMPLATIVLSPLSSFVPILKGQTKGLSDAEAQTQHFIRTFLFHLIETHLKRLIFSCLGKLTNCVCATLGKIDSDISVISDGIRPVLLPAPSLTTQFDEANQKSGLFSASINPWRATWRYNQARLHCLSLSSFSRFADHNQSYLYHRFKDN